MNVTQIQTEPPPARPQAESYGDTVRRLARAQKPSQGAPAYSRFVNRPLGRYLAAGAHHAGLTPNGVTAISGTFSFAAIAVLATVHPSWWSGLVVCLGLVLGYAFDAADGQLARLQGGGSTSGEWLDHMVDATKISTLHLAVLIAAYRFTDLADGWLLVPIGFSIVAAVMFFGMILNEQLFRAKGVARPQATEAPSLVRSLIVLPTDYGFLCLAFIFLGVGQVFHYVYGLFFVGNALFLLLKAVKWYREMSNLDVSARTAATAASDVK